MSIAIWKSESKIVCDWSGIKHHSIEIIQIFIVLTFFLMWKFLNQIIFFAISTRRRTIDSKALIDVNFDEHKLKMSVCLLLQQLSFILYSIIIEALKIKNTKFINYTGKSPHIITFNTFQSIPTLLRPCYSSACDFVYANLWCTLIEYFIHKSWNFSKTKLSSLTWFFFFIICSM